ncbi:glycoside hydrolase family 113 [Demequina sp.]|uniref:glycoside hydrolase family 113 n=1 Tax=Demequina sp. TaxID=2050685 RepID=UPI003A84950C
MTWGFVGTRGEWANPAAAESMRLMVERLHTTWTGIALCGWQDTAFSTEVKFREAPTVTDDEVVWAIREAKSLGQKVVLKPILNVTDGTWRAHINFFDVDVPCEPKWSDWFASYTEFIVHYARIAQAEGVEMFCVGCEMVQTDRRADQWRAVIAAVREVYTGLVTYNCDKYQETNVTWWDAVDVISSSGYYPIDDWDNQLDRIEPVVRTHGKPFFFMEAGVMSTAGSEHLPNSWTLEGGISQEAQRDWYEVMFAVCDRRDWVDGWMLWDWKAQLHTLEEAATNAEYAVYGKLAEHTIAQRYSR